MDAACTQLIVDQMKELARTQRRTNELLEAMTRSLGAIAVYCDQRREQEKAAGEKP